MQSSYMHMGNRIDKYYASPQKKTTSFSSHSMKNNKNTANWTTVIDREAYEMKGGIVKMIPGMNQGSENRSRSSFISRFVQLEPLQKGLD